MRADRLLSILLLLQSRRRITARELAERLEVSERTILRDMEALGGSGIPVVAERGKGGGWSLLKDYQTKLTGLNPAEIQSLFLARPARLMSDLGLKRESEAALIKLQASLPAGVREQAELARGVSSSIRAAGAIPRNRFHVCLFYSMQSGAANRCAFFMLKMGGTLPGHLRNASRPSGPVILSAWLPKEAHGT